MSLLKPDHAEVRALAHAETDPAQAARFRPLAWGPVLTVLALGVVGLISAPWLAGRALVRLARRSLGRG